ncbi:MAG: hypothetical protein NVSMB64_20880 [Candidatus Velthaea sp.]
MLVVAQYATGHVVVHAPPFPSASDVFGNSTTIESTFELAKRSFEPPPAAGVKPLGHGAGPPLRHDGAVLP